MRIEGLKSQRASLWLLNRFYVIEQVSLLGHRVGPRDNSPPFNFSPRGKEPFYHASVPDFKRGPTGHLNKSTWHTVTRVLDSQKLAGCGGSDHISLCTKDKLVMPEGCDGINEDVDDGHYDIHKMEDEMLYREFVEKLQQKESNYVFFLIDTKTSSSDDDRCAKCSV
ncbi:hypothetical protein JHK85_021995 [Glycine max]|nr:hypothetical protein JHK85_021995 [Glycine max]KAG5025643.1 hypothetical protein JHK86_021557 [Glycine max]